MTLLFVTGCARGIVHSMETVEATDAVTAAPDAGAAAADAKANVEASTVDAAPALPTTCEATPNDDACFECCEAMFPKAYDLWDAAYEACCPNDECTDDDSEKCVTVADDLCAKDQECAGLEACEEKNGCWEKVSSER